MNSLPGKKPQNSHQAIGQSGQSMSGQWRKYQNQMQRHSQKEHMIGHLKSVHSELHIWQCTYKVKLNSTNFKSHFRIFFLVLFYERVKLINSPKHRSAKFLMRMLVTFLLLTEPASRNPNPACTERLNIYVRYIDWIDSICDIL